jgi:hypothetical protein
LSYAQAPAEAAPAGGPDAAILLTTVYGGSTSASQAIAPKGGLYGNLQTSTIDQIIMNTETHALAAFYGTSLSYWSRLNLYPADGYFQSVTGTITMAPTDVLTTNVAIAGAGTLLSNSRAGVLYGNGASITGNVTVNSGGTLGSGSWTATATTTVNGNLTLMPGSTFVTTVTNGQASLLKVTGTASLNGTVQASGTATALYSLVGSSVPIITTATNGVSGTFQ